MGKLFQEYQLKDMTLKNRVVMAPMCMYSAEDGIANRWHLVHYASRAVGGVGLVIVEATAVTPEGRISYKDLGLWDDVQIQGLSEIVDAIHAEGCKIGIQLAHAGRKADLEGVDILSSTDEAFNEDYKAPLILDEAGITRIVNAFGSAAKRVLAAGFDLIELHGAHGYLINQFLSPAVNKKADSYGGSPEKRARFLKEVITAVRKEWPAEKPLAVRVSAEEYAENGNHPDMVAEQMNLVKESGLDMVHVSSGGTLPVKMDTWPGYQIRFAETIKEKTGLPVIGGGLVTEAEFADEIVSNNRTDLVFLARALLRNPYWTLDAARKFGVEVDWPKPYGRGK